MDQLVFCRDPQYPGPWTIEMVIPWMEAGRGEWRYKCVRPEGFPHVIKDRIGRYHRVPGGKAMLCFEDELYVKRKFFGGPFSGAKDSTSILAPKAPPKGLLTSGGT